MLKGGYPRRVAKLLRTEPSDRSWLDINQKGHPSDLYKLPCGDEHWLKGHDLLDFEHGLMLASPMMLMWLWQLLSGDETSRAAAHRVFRKKVEYIRSKV